MMKQVTAAVILKEGRVLIAQRSSKDELARLWEFPGGKIEDGETPEECLKREIKEELDIDVDVKDFFAESIYDYENGSISLMAYAVEWLDGELKPMVHDELRWVSRSEISKYEFAPADVVFVKKLVNDKLI